MTNLLELALLGNPEVRLAGQPLARLRSAKVYALLYYLAMTRRTQPRTVLAGLFWGDVDEHDRQTNDDAVSFGGRLLSAYVDRSNTRFWIITEADRSATTILLPSED